MKLTKRPANTPHGALAKLWRIVIRDNHLENSLGYLVSRYVELNSPSAKNLRRKTKSTIEADVTASELTWKKFTHLIFQYLGAVRLDMTIRITYPNGKSTNHTVGLKASEPDDLGDPRDLKESADAKKDEAAGKPGGKQDT